MTAIDRAGGAERWARELGVPQRDRFGHRRGEHWTPATSAAALESLLDGRATWPSRREFEAAGLAGLYIAITETEGHAAMAARYGLALQRPRRRRVDAAPHRAARHRPWSSGRGRRMCRRP